MYTKHVSNIQLSIALILASGFTQSLFADSDTDVRARWFRTFVDGVPQTGSTIVIGTESAQVDASGSYMGGTYDIHVRAEASATRLAGSQTVRLTDYAPGSFQYNSSTIWPYDPAVGLTGIPFFSRLLSPASLASGWTDTLTIAGSGEALMTFTYELSGAFSNYSVPGLGLTYFNDGNFHTYLATSSLGVLTPVSGNSYTQFGNSFPRLVFVEEPWTTVPATVSVTYSVPRGEAITYSPSMQMNSTVVDSVWDPTFTNLYMLAGAGYDVDMFFDMGHTIRLVDLKLTDTNGNPLSASLLSSESGAAYPVSSVPEGSAFGLFTAVVVLLVSARRAGLSDTRTRNAR